MTEVCVCVCLSVYLSKILSSLSLEASGRVWMMDYPASRMW